MTEKEIQKMEKELIALRMEVYRLRGVYSHIVCHGGYTGNPLLAKIREMLLAIKA